MVNPVPGRSITTAYGVAGGWSGGRHGGADWAAPCGTEVVAAWGGTVTGASWGSAFGTQIVVDQDRLPDGSAGLWAVYAHLSESFVRAGQRIEAGQRIGRIGSTGNSTGCHLHYEVQRAAGWESGNHVNPQPWIDAGGQAPAPTPGPQYKYTDRIMSDMLGFDEPPEGYPDGSSDTIKELQWRLNNTKLQGGQTLPETGSYWVETDEEVRLLQAQVFGDTPDPPRKSYLGPKQRAAFFPSPPYTIVDRGLPRIATGGGPDPGPGGGGGVAPPPVPPAPAWFVPDSLKQLRAEVDARWPDRSTASDGTIGDTAHSTSMSEHNPVGHQFGPQFGTPGAVHAMDITARGIDVPTVLDATIGDQRVWYVIHDGHIWSKTYGWEQRPYSGSNPHTTHVHVSLAADDQVSAVRNEQDTAPWIVDLDMPPEYVTREEYDADMDRIAEAFRQAGG